MIMTVRKTIHFLKTRRHLMPEALSNRYEKALNRLAKWRQTFAGWQLGTRPIGDPECDAVRDQAEKLLIMRAEVSALTTLCVERGLFTIEDFQQANIVECEYLQKALEKHFPGFKATDIGMEMDVAKAAETTKNWRP
jgi:hypothetical protein